MVKWGYNQGAKTYDCKTAPQTMEQLLKCPLLEEPCSTADLALYGPSAQKCADKWFKCG